MAVEFKKGTKPKGTKPVLKSHVQGIALGGLALKKLHRDGRLEDYANLKQVLSKLDQPEPIKKAVGEYFTLRKK